MDVAYRLPPEGGRRSSLHEHAARVRGLLSTLSSTARPSTRAKRASPPCVSSPRAGKARTCAGTWNQAQYPRLRRGYLRRTREGTRSSMRAHSARMSSLLRASSLQVRERSSSVTPRCSRGVPSSSRSLPGSTSRVDCGGDEPRIPCPGSWVPYHLRHAGQGHVAYLASPGGEARSSLQSAERYGCWFTSWIPRGIQDVNQHPG